MTKDSKPAPRSKDFIVPLIQDLSIKESLELERKVSKFISYWTSIYMSVWIVISLALIGTVTLWRDVLPDYLPIEPLDDMLALPWALLVIVGFLVPYAFTFSFEGFRNIIRKHVREVAGCEDN